MKFSPIKSVEHIVIHCAATKASQDIGLKELTEWHRQRGFFAVGYHYIIRRNGAVEKGRPDDTPGAHAKGFNDISLGICMAGGIAENGDAENNFTDAQWESLKNLVGQLKLRHPDADVIGHRDLPNVNKACPSFDVRSWWASVREA